MVAWLAVPDPEIEISRGGGGGHPDPEIRGVGLFGPQFGLKIKGSPPSRAPSLDPPLLSSFHHSSL